jgi:uracil-DNA glycosylase family 4
MPCNLCPQFLARQVAGRGPNKPKLIVLGDFPNNDDEVTLRPFSGGRQADRDYSNLIIPRVLTAMGLPESEVYFAYALRCNVKHRAKKIKVAPLHLATCRSNNLDPELRDVDCPVILACGDHALRSLLPDHIGGMRTARGRWHETVIGNQKRLVRVTYSPFFINAMSLYLAAELPSGKIIPTDRWNPPGSCGWLFQQDLKALKTKLLALGTLTPKKKQSPQEVAS